MNARRLCLLLIAFVAVRASNLPFGPGRGIKLTHVDTNDVGYGKTIASLPAFCSASSSSKSIVAFGIPRVLAGGPCTTEGSVELLIKTKVHPTFASSASSATYVSESLVQFYNADCTDGFGTKVATARDYNGDGIEDMIVSAPGETGRGSVIVVYGSAAYCAATTRTEINAPALPQTDSHWLAADAIAVPVQSFDPIDANLGGSSVVGVRLSGMDQKSTVCASVTSDGTVYCWRHDSPANGDLLTYIDSGTKGFKLFSSDGTAPGRVMAAADINGDGYEDLLVSTQFNVDIFIVYGGASNPPAELDLIDANVDGVAIGKIELGSFTITAMKTGDVNGDGIDDVCVSNDNGGAYFGAVFCIYGAEDFGSEDGGVFNIGPYTGGEGNADRVVFFTLDSASSSEGFSGLGTELEVSDYDGDGFDDVFMKIATVPAIYGDGGALFVVFGKAVMPATITMLADLTFAGGSVRASSFFGRDPAENIGTKGWPMVTSNLDNYGGTELVVGAEEQAVYVFQNPPTAAPTSAPTADTDPNVNIPLIAGIAGGAVVAAGLGLFIVRRRKAA